MRKVQYSWLLLALTACGNEPQTTPPRAVPPPAARDVLSVQLKDTPDWQVVSAHITTVDQTQVIARIPGILTTLSVREGDMVRQGQVIGHIHDSQLGFQAGAYGAQAAAAEAQAAQARAELKRVQTLHAHGIYADARLEQAQAAADAAQAQIRAARAQQDAVGAVAGQGAVIAPTTGRVLHADVPAGSPVAPGMVIATITAGAVVLRLDIPESLADRVTVGAAVTATAADGQNHTGTVSKLYPSVTAGQVAADVDMPGLAAAPMGRRLSARVAAGTRRAVVLPQGYVTTRYGIDYVRVLGPDQRTLDVPVQTGSIRANGQLEILSGLRAGDRVVKAGQS